jgi:hypothetical protein
LPRLLARLETATGGAVEVSIAIDNGDASSVCATMASVFHAMHCLAFSSAPIGRPKLQLRHLVLSSG